MEKLNVAIADDNERIVEMLNALIRTENDMEVVGTAGNGEDAVEMIKKSAPDVVLLDLIMPKMDGLGVLEKLKTDPAVRKMPAFIVLSAIGQEAVTEDAFALGANYYIMKPFNNEMLLGRPWDIEIRAELADGIDYSDEIRLTYPKDAVCELSCTLKGLRSFTGVIEGETGKIVMPNYTRPKKAVVYGADGKVKKVIRGKRGYVYEFDAFADSVRRGETECRFMPYIDTVEVMKIMDDCRKLSGLAYPENIENT